MAIHRISSALAIALVLVLLPMPASFDAHGDFISASSEKSETGGMTASELQTPAPPRRDITPAWTYATGAPMLSSPKTADLDGDGTHEIILTTYAPGENPYAYGLVHVLDSEGQLLPGWPVQTPGPIPATAAVADVDGAGGVEIVIADWSWLHVFRPDGTELSGWPIPVGSSQSCALEDLDGDGDAEILHPANTLMHIYQHDGTELPGWPQAAPEQIGSPAVASVDDDLEVEIIAATFEGPVGPDPFELYVWNLDGTVVSGFPVSTSGVNKVPPAVGDIDGDGDMEILLPSYDTSNNDYLYAVDGTGAAEPGWPVRGSRIRLSPPALADVDGNGTLETFIGGDGLLYGFASDGSALPGFPASLTAGQANSGPVIGEVDGESSRVEIFVKNANTINGIHSDGTTMTDFPYTLSDFGHSGTTSPSPCITDVDGDDDMEVVMASAFDLVVMVDFQEITDSALLHWPSYKRDPLNRSRFTMETSGVSDGVSVDSAPLRVWPSPSQGQVWLSWPGGDVRHKVVRIFDTRGRCVRRWTLPPGETRVQWDGRDANARSVAPGIYSIVGWDGEQIHKGRAILMR
ncbi:MAG: hypothetical protein GF355_06245 [Candidatus Eisenbacteria bacterium]|nr:hypothetical protein [Candidatus Eisenbacteria bacterium]